MTETPSFAETLIVVTVIDIIEGLERSVDVTTFKPPLKETGNLTKTFVNQKTKWLSLKKENVTHDGLLFTIQYTDWTHVKLRHKN